MNDVKTELKEIKKNLKATLTGFKDAERGYGYDLANETYYVKQALRQVNLLLSHNVVGRSEHLPERLCKNNPNFKCNCIDQDRCPNFPPY